MIHWFEEFNVTLDRVVKARAGDCDCALVKFVEILVFESILDFFVLFHFKYWHTEFTHKIVSIVFILVVQRYVEILVELTDVKVKDALPFLSL